MKPVTKYILHKVFFETYPIRQQMNWDCLQYTNYCPKSGHHCTVSYSGVAGKTQRRHEAYSDCVQAYTQDGKALAFLFYDHCSVNQTLGKYSKSSSDPRNGHLWKKR